jgi:hypothetical protein
MPIELSMLPEENSMKMEAVRRVDTQSKAVKNLPCSRGVFGLSGTLLRQCLSPGDKSEADRRGLTFPRAWVSLRLLS